MVATDCVLMVVLVRMAVSQGRLIRRVWPQHTEKWLYAGLVSAW